MDGSMSLWARMWARSPQGASPNGLILKSSNPFDEMAYDLFASLKGLYK